MTNLETMIVEFLIPYLSYGNLIGFFQALGDIATFVALFFIWNTFRHEKDKQQTQLAYDIFKDIRQLEQEFSKLDKPVNGNFEVIDDWYSRYFNTLEWLSFLINEKKITNKETRGFLEPLIKESYEEFYMDSNRLKRSPDEPKEFSEFKRLYQKLKV